MEVFRGTAGPDELVASMSDTLVGGAGDDTLGTCGKIRYQSRGYNGNRLFSI